MNVSYISAISCLHENYDNVVWLIRKRQGRGVRSLNIQEFTFVNDWILRRAQRRDWRFLAATISALFHPQVLNIIRFVKRLYSFINVY